MGFAFIFAFLLLKYNGLFLKMKRPRIRFCTGSVCSFNTSIKWGTLFRKKIKRKQYRGPNYNGM
jgi:hypothetical protein